MSGGNRTLEKSQKNLNSGYTGLNLWLQKLGQLSAWTVVITINHKNG